MPKPRTEADLRPILTPIRDQGRRETCLAFALTAAHEARRALGPVAELELSEEMLYWGGRQFYSNPYGGGITFGAAEKALATWGQPLRHLWPYDEVRNENGSDYQPPEAALLPENSYKAVLTGVALEVPVILEHLDRQVTVVLALRMSEQFFYTTDGYIELPALGQVIAASHAVLIVGWREATNDRPRRLVFRNSWGGDWGDQGYGYLPFDYVSTLGISACAVAVR